MIPVPKIATLCATLRSILIIMALIATKAVPYARSNPLVPCP